MKRFLNIFIFLLFLFYFSLFTFHLKAQWVQQSLPVNKPITGIEFVDTLHGWACTSRGNPPDTGYILYTSNGGTNWLVQFKQYNFAFADIDMINSLTGYTGGFLYGAAIPRMYKTTNGGMSWDSISLNINHFIDDIFFVNASSGWTCNALFGPDVRTTTDGGNTWTLRISGITQQTNKLFFLNYDTGFCGASGIFYRTTNAGMNWTLNGTFGQTIRGIFFINLNIGWLGLSNGRIASTTNGGVNWTVQQPFPLNGNITTDIYFLNSSTGYAGTGWFQKILKTTNAGNNWGHQFVPTGSLRISIVDNLNAWCGDIGISRTTNSGGNITYEGIAQISTDIPKSYRLFQNYPNPFNPVTIIQFDIKAYTFVKLLVFDIIGRETAVLVNQKLYPGSYEFRWNAGRLSSGLYFYRLIINENIIDSRKMILMK